jgi:uncharacterized protein (TIGR02270 family)
MKEIISQFAEEAAFLWNSRVRAVDESHFSLSDLARLDMRIEAHLDGLRVAGNAGWQESRNRLGSGYAEDLFPAAVLAFESGNETRIEEVISAAKDTSKARVLVSALGWLDYEQSQPVVEQLLASDSPLDRYIGIAASAANRRDPGRDLDEALESGDFRLVTRALRAYGELGRRIRLGDSALKSILSNNNNEIRFSAAWSATLTGHHEAIEILKRLVLPDSLYSVQALNTCIRRMNFSDAHQWREQLAASPDTIRFAIIGAGAIGDPVLVPWLIDLMAIPALARIAGESFSMTTGVAIDVEELRGRHPEGFNAGPDDNPENDNTSMDSDGNLPWPDVHALTRWWGENRGSFQNGIRNLLGRPITEEYLWQVLKTGLQRQRAAAALELALMQPGRPLFNVRAPGFRQQEVLRQNAEVW